MMHQVILLLIVCLVRPAISFGSGPPTGPTYTYCDDLMPPHTGGVVQTSVSPVNITPSVMTSGNIQVVLSGAIGGFILQGRNSSGHRVGRFSTPTGTAASKAKFIANCDGGDTSMGHSTSTEASSLTFTWEAPGNGSVQFVASFVQASSKNTIWHNETTDFYTHFISCTTCGASFQMITLWLTVVMAIIQAF